MGLEEKLGETALDLVKNENVQNKVADLFGMLLVKSIFVCKFVSVKM